MFDCVLPTRSGRTGQAFTADGPLNMRNARFAEDREPIEPGCPCPACTTFSRAYVHHLVKSGEILGAMLMTQHNLWFYQRLMQGLRDAIAAQRLQAFASEFLGSGTAARPRSRRPYRFAVFVGPPAACPGCAARSRWRRGARGVARPGRRSAG